MRRLFVLALFCGLAAPIIAMADQQRQTPDSNVTVTECTPHFGKSDAPTSTANTMGTERSTSTTLGDPSVLRFSFTNDAKIAAKEIDVALIEHDRVVQSVKDSGTFSPGEAIHHKFRLDPAVSPIGAGSAYCAIAAVKYADGTSWTAPSPAPSP